MSKTDELISKLEELVEQYKAYYDSIQSPAVKITTGWMDYNNQLESEISQLKEQIKKEEQSHELIKRVKEAWTPEKRSFEEMESKKKQSLKSAEDILRKHSRIGHEGYILDAMYEYSSRSMKNIKNITDEEIEKQILKIIDNSFEKISLPGIGKNDTDDGFIFNKNKASKEIAALFENMYPVEFVEWLIFGDHLFSDINNKWIFYESISMAIRDEEDEGIIMTTKEVYEYWKTEIKKGE
jgi:hypothetical protein